MDAKKLRRKLLKLAKWAKRHGYDHVDLFVFAPDDRHEEWYGNIAAKKDGEHKVLCSRFFSEEEVTND